MDKYFIWYWHFLLSCFVFWTHILTEIVIYGEIGINALYIKIDHFGNDISSSRSYKPHLIPKLTVSRLVLQLSLPNPLKQGVK